ncbi:MAG: AEC family transporter [Parachlamydiaceae bacterium]|nr:AEC family transporter [Parachlamydiaceae bacterium]
MYIFTNLALKLLPLYLNIILGYIAGKKLEANRDTITKIMFYMINPLIILNGVLHTKIDAELLTLPLLTFLLSSIICVIFYRISRRIWDDSSKNIMAFSAGSGNTGYFGIPLAMMIFDPQTQGVYILAILGLSLYENSLGYYISAKGIYTPKECFAKLLTLPTIYAFLLGLLLNYLAIPVPEVFRDFMGHIKGVYAVLGMMIIGIGLAGLTNFKLDMKFLGMTFLAKFLVWPALILLAIEIDSRFFGFYDHNVHQSLILLSIVPLAVNTVVMASLMKSEPEKIAATVLISTIFALFYIPFMTSLFLS